MKKIFFLIAFLLFITVQTNSVFAGFISNSISVKRSGNISYGNDITLNGNDDLFNLRINIITDTSEPNNDFKVIINALPTSLTASGYVLESDTCVSKIKNITQQDNTIHYTYTPNGGVPCNAILTANYITNNTADGTYNITYTIQNQGDNSLRVSNNSATVNVNNLLRVVKAESIDNDTDGFIEKYSLTFNKDIGTNVIIPANVIISDNNNTATNISFVKTSSTTGELHFVDGVFSTGDTPDINITTTHNTYEQNIYNLGTIEDAAAPYISTINNNVYNGSPITISTLPSSLIINFTESVRENDISGVTLQLNASNISGTSTLNNDKDILTFTPSVAFVQGDYTILFHSKTIDLAGNIMPLGSAGVTLGTPATSQSGGGNSSGGSSGGGSSGGGSSGGGSFVTNNFETEKYLSTITTKINKLKTENNLIGLLELDNDNIITNNSQLLILKVSKSSVSEVQIGNDISIQGYTQSGDNIFYPAIQLDKSKIAIGGNIVIDKNELITGKISEIYEFNPQFSQYELSDNIKLQLKLNKKSTIYPLYIYFLNDITHEWKKFDSQLYVMDKETSSITFFTNKFGYYLILQNRYIDQNPIKVKNINTETLLKSNNTSFLKLENILMNTLKIAAIEKLAAKFLIELQPRNYQYFLSFDTELKSEYDRYAVSFYSLFVNLEKYVKTKNPYWKKIILANLPTLIEGIQANRDLELRYVNKNIILGNLVYVPKNQVINKATGNLQNMILKKLNNLILTETISLEEYNTAMNAYNYFILHLGIFVEFKFQDAKDKALEQLKIFMATYNKKIIISNN